MGRHAALVRWFGRAARRSCAGTPARHMLARRRIACPPGEEDEDAWAAGIEQWRD